MSRIADLMNSEPFFKYSMLNKRLNLNHYRVTDQSDSLEKSIHTEILSVHFLNEGLKTWTL